VNRLSGITLLLPHGLEGQGPEHSSARLERFLQLCSETHPGVCYPTTPAQIFHLFRRQVVRPWRKPLIVMTPKSLLRHKQAVSSLATWRTGPSSASSWTGGEEGVRALLCTGKIYYDLIAAREAKKRDDVAIVPLRALYPLSTPCWRRR